MKISTLSKMNDFALLGPGFSSSKSFVLLTRLELSENPSLVLMDFESSPGQYLGYSCRDCISLEPEFDIAPQSFSLQPDFSNHAQGVEIIREAIAAGDVYQVCLTCQIPLQEVEAGALFTNFCKTEVPPYAAWLKLPGGRQIISASPELFFSLCGNVVQTQPMKGTAGPRGVEQLEHSAKDQCELAMITDLLRNDLGPLCVQGSIKVKHGRNIIRLSYASQTVSEITGVLLPGTGPLDVLAGLHPGGSVTGAPKAAALEMIAALESVKRGAYCGSLGFLREDWAVFSLLIRTAQSIDGKWTYGVGGAVVYDSSPLDECEELKIKMGPLL